MNINNKNTSHKFIEFMIGKEEAPFQFKLGIKKSEKISNHKINKEIRSKLFEFKANITDQLEKKYLNEKNDIIYKFDLNDKKQALACYRFFNGHHFRKKD